ncbi:hypothetical protein [Pedobacter sp. R-06]|uniref:hypothetical protein n=1 Tax=Pedobacter sp. R-06 TaxID=3404051 RepID=UPI003CEBF5B7
METKTLEWLQTGQFRILKHIVVIADRNHNEIELGSIFYKREFTSEYKMTETEENETDPILKLLDGLKQKNYPSDAADHIILEAIKKQYPKSYVRNDTLFFNVDLEMLTVLKNRNVVAGKLYFVPEFSNTDIYRYVGKSFPSPKIGFNFYTYYNAGAMHAAYFSANYPAENPGVLDLFQTIEFE